MFRRNRSFSNAVMRSVVVCVVIVGLLKLAVPFGVKAGPKPPPLTRLDLRSESQLKTEAGWYDSAIREISRISSMNLTRPEDAKTARAILDKHVPNLRYNRSKLATIGLADSTFISAVRAKAKDKTSAEQLALDLIKDQQAVFRISGGQSLADRMRRSLTEDLGIVRRVAAQLKKASEDLKAQIKNNHSRTTGNSPAKESVLPLAPLALEELTVGQIAVITVAVAVIAVPPLGLALLTIGNAVIGVTVLAGAVVTGAAVIQGAVLLTALIISNLTTDEGQDRVAACQRQVDAQYRRCMNAAQEFGIFRSAAELTCYADWLLASGSCLLAQDR